MPLTQLIKHEKKQKMLLAFTDFNEKYNIKERFEDV